MFTGNLANARERIAISVNTLKNHFPQTICQLAINWALVVKLNLHGSF